MGGMIIACNHGPEIGCLLTSGIFAWIAAHAAVEETEAGGEGITPYWRTLKVGGELNPKYPGGIEAQKRLLESEGHRIVRKAGNSSLSIMKNACGGANDQETQVGGIPPVFAKEGPEDGEAEESGHVQDARGG